MLHVEDSGAMVVGEGEYPITALPPSQTAIGLGSPARASGETFERTRVHRKVTMPTTAHVASRGWRTIASTARRLAVVTVGFALCGAGLIMLVLPGPGILIIFLGLLALATECSWAHRALERTRSRANDATGRLYASRIARLGVAILIPATRPPTDGRATMPPDATDS